MKLEDLQERIKKNKLKKEQGINESPFSAFISYHNLNKGLDKLATFLLYYIYIRHMQRRFKDYPPLSKIAFFKELKLHLHSVRWGKQRYYLIDKSSIINITEELEFEAKIYEKGKKVPKRTKQ